MAKGGSEAEGTKAGASKAFAWPMDRRDATGVYQLDAGREVVLVELATLDENLTRMEPTQVAATEVALGDRDAFVSTVFIGQYGSPGAPKPQMFETMVFARGGSPEAKTTYATWAEAETGHWAMVGMLRSRYLVKPGS